MPNTFKIEGDDIFFTFPFNKTIVEEVKVISGARWNSILKAWVVPIRIFNENAILRFIENNSFQEYQETIVKAEQKITFTPIDYAHIEGRLSMLNLCFQPRDYQKESIAYGLKYKKIINGDDMGLGKTYVSALTIEMERAFPCLVITPASVKYNFAAEWEKYTGRTSISVIESKETSKRKNNWDADVIVINYDILGKLIDNGRRSKSNPDRILKDLELKFSEMMSIGWKGIIIDEAHFLKNKDAARSKSVAKIIKNIPMRLLLTGTAISSRPDEGINLFKLCNSFEAISPDWNHFVHRYCNAKRTNFGWDTSGATNTIELNQKMRDTCYIRHEKSDVLKELPDVIKTVLNVPVTNKKQYNLALADLFGYIANNDSLEKAISSQSAEHLVKLSVLRKLSLEGKMKAVYQYISDWKESSREKLIIFALHRDPLIDLSKKFKGDLIIGGINSKRKYDMVQDFKTNDKQFIFASMDAIAVGVDGLQDSCSNMLILELPWVTSLLEQGISRLDRSGQTKPVNVNFMLANDTIDMDMWEMLERKGEICNEVIKGTRSFADKMINVKEDNDE